MLGESQQRQQRTHLTWKGGAVMERVLKMASGNEKGICDCLKISVNDAGVTWTARG